jgi:endonuclease/exonuclease/phosphatase family metal-dependent hydrolase
MSDPPVTRVGVWNVEWARPHSRRGQAVAGRLVSWDCDVLVVTEGEAALLPDHGHVVDSEEDYGYRVIAGRRKVLLWSRNPWREVERRTSADLPSGRIASGVTDTPAGPVRVVGVCIPWRDAHVPSGRRDRDGWQDHLRYLNALGPWLEGLPPDPPLVVAGDFNQRVPANGQPARVAQGLADALGGLVVASAGLTHAGRRLIDHLAHDPALRTNSICAIGRERPAGPRLSDHDGVVVELVAASGDGPDDDRAE